MGNIVPVECAAPRPPVNALALSHTLARTLSQSAADPQLDRIELN
jgi:hypothetical protein